MSPLDVGLPRARPNERTLAQVQHDCLYWAFRRDPDRFWACVIGEFDASEEES